MSQQPPPIFTAVTASVRHIYSLLRCTAFDTKATIQITHDGLRVTVEDSRVMQAHAFVDKNLFSCYSFEPHIPCSPVIDNSTATDLDPTILFGISLSALLECLQIFSPDSYREKWGSNASNTNHSGSFPAGGGGYGGGGGGKFDQGGLRNSGTCKFSYHGVGSPLLMTLEEGGVVTTCELATWEPEVVDDIPIARDSIVVKIIMKAGWLYDAIQELGDSLSAKLTIFASPQAPFFSLSASGTLGSTVVEFSNEKSLLETFSVPAPVQYTYKFGLIKNAAKAMAASTKVSIRGDASGTLSMQFMIEQEGERNPSFIDFRFVSYADNSSDEE